MCIRNDKEKVAKLRQQMTVLQLWKIVKKDNGVGLWRETNPMKDDLQSFHVGEILAHDYSPRDELQVVPGAFHCFFTRKVARKYLKYRMKMSIWKKVKIIKVHANSQDIVSIGVEKYSGFFAVSVSRMTIKSLKHQR